jgi:hypothetical protein
LGCPDQGVLVCDELPEFGHEVLVADALVWADFGRAIRPDQNMLEGFVDLVDRPADRILRYAMTWGPLFTTCISATGTAL